MTLVSAVMPTRGRKEYAAKALDCFLSQTWPDKELIILDDADNRSFDTAPDYPHVRYRLAERRMNIPDKRNIVCEAALGDIIVNFDSDDWSAPTRMLNEMEFMEQERKEVVGYKTMYFWDEGRKQAWFYKGTIDYVLGTSLMFTRKWWARQKWNHQFRVGSDNIFIAAAVRQKQLGVSPATDQMVARTHLDNTSPRRYGTRWQKSNVELFPQEFFTNEDRTIEAPIEVPTPSGDNRPEQRGRIRIVGR